MNCLKKYGLKIYLILFLIFSYSITAETKKLLILGDSISAGYGIKESENWVSILETSLNRDNFDIKIINSSVSGDTTIGGLSRIKNDLNNYSPDYVLIELGGNDALRGYPLNKIKSNLNKIIYECIEEGSIPFIMQIRIPPNYGRRYVEAFENIYPELAEENGLKLFSFLLQEVALEKDLMQLDGIHPNVKAQPIIANQLKDELLNVLK
jgi:acyl-CoA thioesterase-1